MGAKGIFSAVLLLFMLLIPETLAKQNTPISQATVGVYTVTMALNPDPPQVGQPVDIRLSINREGEMLENFTATVNMYREDDKEGALVYTLEGTFPTSELLIPYQFLRDGAYWVVVDIPDAGAVQDGTLSIRVREPAPKAAGIGAWPLWVRMLIAMLIIAAFWKFRWPKRHRR